MLNSEIKMKHFINLKDIPAKDLRKIVNEAKKRKYKRKNFSTLDVDKDNPLEGKLLIQMFEKSSLRTRLSFYLAIKQLGGGTITLRSNELHLGKGGESLADTARILSTYGDGFMLRADSDKKIEEFSKYLTIPIINGLSPSSHPTQVLSDIFTVEEIKKKPIYKLNIGCPKNYEPKKFVLDWVKKNKAQIHIYNDAKKAAMSADVIFSDKVISLNDKVNKVNKVKDFKNFKINSEIMSFAKKDATFLHCLPRGAEVSSEVFLGKNSKVWLQALNRVHVQKSILLYCFGKLR